MVVVSVAVERCRGRCPSGSATTPGARLRNATPFGALEPAPGGGRDGFAAARALASAAAESASFSPAGGAGSGGGAGRRARPLGISSTRPATALTHVAPPGAVVVGCGRMRPLREALEHRVERRDQEQREEGRDREAADDRARQRQVGLAALADAERHRDEARRRWRWWSSGSGRRRVRPASTVASMSGMPRRAQHVGEVDEQHAVRDHDADHHDDAHEAVDRERGPGRRRASANTPRDAQRHAEHDDQRVEQRLELRREHHVDERERHQRREAEARRRPAAAPRSGRRAARVKPSGGGSLVERPAAPPALAAPRSLPGATLAVTSMMRCRYLRLMMHRAAAALDRAPRCRAAPSPPAGVRRKMSPRSATLRAVRGRRAAR